MFAVRRSAAVGAALACLLVAALPSAQLASASTSPAATSGVAAGAGGSGGGAARAGAGYVKEFDSVASVERAIASAHPWFIKWYAPWCGHCASLAPHFEAAAKVVAATAGMQDVRFGSVNCDELSDACSARGITAFPRLMFYGAGSGPAAPVQYEAPRTQARLVDFVRRMMRPAPMHLVRGAAAQQPADGALPWPADFDPRAWAAKHELEGVLFVFAIPAPAASAQMSSAQVDAFATSVADAALAMRDKVTVIMADLGQWTDATPAAPGDATRAVETPLLASWAVAIASAVGAPAGTPMLLQAEAGTSHVDVLLPRATALRIEAGAVVSVPDLGLTARVRTISANAASGAQQLAEVSVWMQRARLPALTVVTGDNFASMLHNGHVRRAALALYNTNKLAANAAPSRQFVHDFQSVAAKNCTALSPSVRDEFVFGLLDVSTFAAFLTQFGWTADEAPGVLVLDAPSKAFWTDKRVRSLASLQQFLGDVQADRIPTQRIGLLAWPQAVYNQVGPVPAFTAVGLLLALVAWFVWRFIIKEILTAMREPPRGAKPVASVPGNKQQPAVHKHTPASGQPAGAGAGASGSAASARPTTTGAPRAASAAPASAAPAAPAPAAPAADLVWEEEDGEEPVSLEDGDDYVSDGEGEAAARARQDEEDATAADLFPGEVVLPKNVAPVLRRRSARKVAAA